MWTHESLAASASLMKQGNQDLVLLVCKGQQNAMYVGGPLANGVGVIFASDAFSHTIQHDMRQCFHTSVMTLDSSTWSDGTAILHPHNALANLEAMGPIQSLDIQQTSVTTQNLMDIQSEIEEIREILKPSHQRASPTYKKSMSRKKRTKLTKQLVRSTTKQQPKFIKAMKKDMGVSTPDLLLRRLEEGGCTFIDMNEEGWWQTSTLVFQQQAPSHAHIDLDSRTLCDVPVLEVAVVGCKTVRLLVLSDTHGFEDQLFKTNENSQVFPPADILVHCGDWWGNHNSRDRLDQVMAAQTHIPTKIVVRGNHDPIHFNFALSGASYITKPCVMEMNGLVMEIRPFRRSRTIQPLLHPNVDILLTHEPPYGILDLTYRKERVGSIVLRHAVESSPNKPKLWCCGHIHEGRGAKSHIFGNSQQRTLVVNCANANSGKAKRIITGPVLIDCGGNT